MGPGRSKTASSLGKQRGTLMKLHPVKVHPSKALLKREDQLAWKMAGVAVDKVAVQKDVAAMIINRVIDNASVAIAAINRRPVVSARGMALGHAKKAGGASVFGVKTGTTVSPEWAAWANGTAVRELDMHDTFLAADYSHPGDNIPPLLAVGQAMGRSGKDLIRGLATAYELHIDLVRAICLHEHKVDHIAHLCPAAAAGIGTMLGLKQEVVFQSIQQALHTSVSFRQSRKGEISSWKAYAPAHAGKLAIEAVDRCMRGEGAPSPIYEGEDSVIAWVLSGRTQADSKGRKTVYDPTYYEVPLPEAGEPKRAILDSYTKEHSAEIVRQVRIMAGRRQPIRQRSARKRNTIRCRSICAQASAGLDQPRESFWVVRPEKTADANSPEFSRTQGELHSVLAVEEGYGLCERSIDELDAHPPPGEGGLGFGGRQSDRFQRCGSRRRHC